MVDRDHVRDRLMPETYFDEQLRYNEEALKRFRDLIASADTTPEHRRQLRHTVYRRELEQLITRYSRGEPIEALRVAYPKVIEALAEYQRQAGGSAHDFDHFDAYVLALWITSLAILLGVDDSDARRAVQELDNEGRDCVFDRLVALRSAGRTPTATVMYPNPYQPLRDALDASGDEQTRLIEDFLARWYDGMGPAYWHGSHRRRDAGYFGYWCFELAAFVKGLGIDDRAFANHPHYPRDLVHQSGIEGRKP
jgi:hypothetical protein